MQFEILRPFAIARSVGIHTHFVAQPQRSPAGTPRNLGRRKTTASGAELLADHL